MPAWQVTPIQAVKKVWEKIAPLQLAERSWDNVGIMIESPVANPAHRQVLLTIDLTTAVCNEALNLPQCSVIVSYHPPIFRGLKSMTLADPLQASLLRLSAKGISVFSPHTSLDATPNGINTFLIQPFVQYAKDGTSEVITPPGEKVAGFEGAGMGRRVDLGKGLEVSEVVRIVKEHLSLEHVQIATPQDQLPIESIAVCAGSGGSILKDAPADLLLTGEMSHHEVLAAVAKGQTVILTNHSNTERPYLSKVLQTWLQDELNKEHQSLDRYDHTRDTEITSIDGKWEVVVSKEDRDPLRTV